MKNLINKANLEEYDLVRIKEGIILYENFFSKLIVKTYNEDFYEILIHKNKDYIQGTLF